MHYAVIFFSPLLDLEPCIKIATKPLHILLTVCTEHVVALSDGTIADPYDLAYRSVTILFVTDGQTTRTNGL